MWVGLRKFFTDFWLNCEEGVIFEDLPNARFYLLCWAKKAGGMMELVGYGRYGDEM